MQIVEKFLCARKLSLLLSPIKVSDTFQFIIAVAITFVTHNRLNPAPIEITLKH